MDQWIDTSNAQLQVREEQFAEFDKKYSGLKLQTSLLLWHTISDEKILDD